MDLIGPGDMEHHFVDATQAIKALSLTGQWVDLGSGAGFPGIALAAEYPAIHVTMIESRQKRATFLRQVCHQGNAQNITIQCARTENIHGPFDGVISRAYKPPLLFLEDALRLTKIGGLAIVMLGEHGSFPIPKEWLLQNEQVYTLPDEHGLRKRWVLERVS
jgi:16S rRNA (guanine(527)-N(7))-methyltransferase RsmG